ncbi:MAG: hypothetical protein ABJO01_14575 [Parasphingorhabdus sp.]|uniref:hypothetical protein n=1 Tax=Parasphingorhabdus sp. TaxID=2709688 RepID=UPI0032989EC6
MMNLNLRTVREALPAPILPLALSFYRVVNILMAKKPEFAIIGTGRSGSTYVAEMFKASGYECSHEAYFTPEGPKLRNPERGIHCKGDSSWLAVPFLPDPDIVAIHQVRHPHKVILSTYNLGWFDENIQNQRMPFYTFAKEHFEFSDDPLQSSLRWYIEWNQRCELITDKRFQIEKLSENIDNLSNWLGRDLTYIEKNRSSNSNSRRAVVDNPLDDISDRIKEYPEYDRLLEMAETYGYVL